MVIEMEGICDSEYSTENVSAAFPEYGGTETVMAAPFLTRNVYPPGHTL